MASAVNHDSYSDAYIRSVFEATGTIVVVGASPKPAARCRNLATNIVARLHLALEDLARRSG